MKLFPSSQKHEHDMLYWDGQAAWNILCHDKQLVFLKENVVYTLTEPLIVACRVMLVWCLQFPKGVHKENLNMCIYQNIRVVKISSAWIAA